MHWVLEHDTPASRGALVALIFAWNERKKRFSSRQIGLAADVLTEKGWTGGAIAARR